MSVLDRIIDDNRDLLARRKRETPISALEDSPGYRLERRSLATALRGDGIAIIAEIKRMSPSKGLLRENFAPVDIARSYEDAGAAAVSVLTEPFHFGGDLDHLSSVREAVELPVLRKDFLFDTYHIVEARSIGADAVLLIAEVLDPGQFEELFSAAEELGLDVLVEIHEPRNLDRLEIDRIKILGVNNRDLKTFEVDINHAGDVLRSVPSSIVRIAESGIRTADDLLLLHDSGLDAALIGEAFMRADQPGDELRRLREAYLERLETR